MIKPAIPINEESRIEALKALNVLDTPAEERFDQLTRMAKRLFDVPIALVSLVDEDRQWFKSSAGLDAEETHRDISFCGHAILGSEVFIIPNAEKDERFTDNPLVAGDPNIRFYAGCPLAVNGHKLGTLCLIDKAPRDFGDDDIAMLQDLTSMVVRELEAVQLASLDELTNIANRRGFQLLSKHALSLAIRNKTPVSLIFMDLDKFKIINDKFGHAEGDIALVAFAKLIKSTFRDSDLCARLGGDEFVVLLSGSTADQTKELIERFSRSLQEHNLSANRGYDISFSSGVVQFNQERHATIDDVLAEGDAIMYKSKNQ